MSPSQFHSLLKGGSIDKLRQAVKSTAGENSNSDEGYWKPTVDKAGNGSAIIRFLPAPPPELTAGSGQFVAPGTEIEKQLARIWEEVLGVPRAGRDDDFFALGGHSLLAVQLISRLRQAMGIETPLAALDPGEQCQRQCHQPGEPDRVRNPGCVGQANRAQRGDR